MKFDESMNVDALSNIIQGVRDSEGGWLRWASALDVADVYDNTLCEQGAYIIDRAIHSHGISLIEDLPKVSAAVWGHSGDTWLTDLAREIEEDRRQGKVLGYDLTDRVQWERALIATIERKGTNYAVVGPDNAGVFFVDDGELMLAPYDEQGEIDLSEPYEFHFTNWFNGAIDEVSWEQTQSFVTAPKFVSLYPRFYMHPVSGEVQKEDEWLSLLTESGVLSEQESIEDVIDFLIEVEKDENGQWVEAGLVPSLSRHIDQEYPKPKP